MKMRYKKDEQTEEQIRLAAHLKYIDGLAKKAGFDDDAFAHTEFSLLPFFNLVVEECARIAEQQAYVYDGSTNEGNGCRAAAAAIRNIKDK